MSIDEKSFVPGSQGIGSFGPVGSVPPTPKNLPDVNGADFSRILEELLAAAGNLGAQASVNPPSDPKALQDAVAEAKQSLDAAMSLGESLLEAYQKALITDPKKHTPNSGNGLP